MSLKNILFFFLISLILGCALQVAPSGGLKDELAPNIQKEEPPSGTTNFDEVEFRISFDEFIKLERLKDQVVVSPPLKYNLNAQVRGKELRVRIKDTLKEGTTYVFNFGNAIVDLHENNPISNYTYVLSTGSSIDSGRVGGKVYESFEAEPAEKVSILAYSSTRENLDSLPYLEKPDYVAKTNKEGKFSLEFMKEGTYKLFGLLDENDNYVFDKKTEKIAFIKDLVNTSEGMDSIGMYLFQEDHESQFVKEQRENGPSTLLQFNLEVDSFNYSTDLLDSMEFSPLLVESKLPDDSIIFWWPEVKLRFPMIIQADTLIDTLKLAIDTIDIPKKLDRLPLQIQKFGPHVYYASPRFNFQYPIKSINDSLITLLDSDSSEVEFEFQKSRRSNELIFKYDQKESENYVLLIDSAAIKDIYGHTNDSLGIKFKLDEESDYGSLKVDFKVEDEGPYILQLVTPSKKFIKEVCLQEPSYTFENLQSGTFSLKLILDKNGNGKWDTGNYIEGVQPEKVINYQGEIRIRIRWAKEVQWVIVE